jgi:hypothetical protein
MRYIGSKAASLPAIARVVAGAGASPGSLCDPFAGACTVARHFKAAGWRIVAGDLLALSYALQVAYVRLNRPPAFLGLAAWPGVGGGPPVGRHRARPGAVGTAVATDRAVREPGRSLLTPLPAIRGFGGQKGR